MPDDEILNEQDAILAMNAMESLLDLLNTHPSLMDSFLSVSAQAPKAMVVTNLLNYRHQDLRIRTLKILQSLSQIPAAREWLLDLCVSALEQADALPIHCGQFYTLLCDLVSSITTPHEVRVCNSSAVSAVMWVLLCWLEECCQRAQHCSMGESLRIIVLFSV